MASAPATRKYFSRDTTQHVKAIARSRIADRSASPEKRCANNSCEASSQSKPYNKFCYCPAAFHV